MSSSFYNKNIYEICLVFFVFVVGAVVVVVNRYTFVK